MKTDIRSLVFIKNLFKDDVKGLKEILKTNYKVSKVDELSMENASKIIKDRKEEK